MAFIRSKTHVLNHWISFAEAFSMSSLEFYEHIGNELESRKIPGLQKEHIEFSEGGALSDKRIYLRVLRERLVFDICAAPFGTSFFFSCRTSVIPAVVRPWQLLLLAAALYLGLKAFFSAFGFFNGMFWFIAANCAAIYIMRNAVALGLQDLDRALLQAPVIGAVYEAWFRKETYFREDSRLVYLEAIPRIVREAAEEACGAKGVKLLRQYAQAPALGNLYKSVDPMSSRTSTRADSPVTPPEKEAIGI